MLGIWQSTPQFISFEHFPRILTFLIFFSGDAPAHPSKDSSEIKQLPSEPISEKSGESASRFSSTEVNKQKKEHFSTSNSPAHKPDGVVNAALPAARAPKPLSHPETLVETKKMDVPTAPAEAPVNKYVLLCFIFMHPRPPGRHIGIDG